MDKPAGPTSHDVVAAARRALDIRRIGHTGTLDPFASGLLLLCVGRVTRIAEFLTDLDKCYEATARLGVSTDTEDLEGEVIAESESWRTLASARIEAAADKLRGTIEQTPPAFSAKRIGGERAHRLARRGEAVALAPRTVIVHELEVSAVDLPLVHFRVRCSSGTYVRSIARDLGLLLETGAHLIALRRTRIGGISVDGAASLEDLSAGGGPAGAWIEPLDALGHLPRIELGTGEGAALRHGRTVPAPGAESAETVVAAEDGLLVAVGGVRSGTFHPRKVFA